MKSINVHYGLKQNGSIFSSDLNHLRIQSENTCLSTGSLNEKSIIPTCKIFFMHIHKAGGSTICAMAKLNNYTIPINGTTNCNLISSVDENNRLDPNPCFNLNNINQSMVNHTNKITWHELSPKNTTNCILSQPYQFMAAETYNEISFPVHPR